MLSGLPVGAAVSAGLDHPHSQDSILPTGYLIINTETDTGVKWLVKNFSQCV